MSKMTAPLLITILAAVGWLSTAHGDDTADPQPPAAAAPAAAEPAPQAIADSEAPRLAAKEFAPWIEAVIQEKNTMATRMFPIRKPAQDVLEAANTLRIFRKLPKIDGLDLALIGGRGLGEQAGVLLFTITTESGPIAIKIYHYRFGTTRSVGKIEVTDDWNEIERLYTTVDPLTAPVVVPL